MTLVMTALVDKYVKRLAKRVGIIKMFRNDIFKKHLKDNEKKSTLTMKKSRKEDTVLCVCFKMWSVQVMDSI